MEKTPLSPPKLTSPSPQTPVAAPAKSPEKPAQSAVKTPPASPPSPAPTPAKPAEKPAQITVKTTPISPSPYLPPHKRTTRAHMTIDQLFKKFGSTWNASACSKARSEGSRMASNKGFENQPIRFELHQLCKPHKLRKLGQHLRIFHLLRLLHYTIGLPASQTPSSAPIRNILLANKLTATIAIEKELRIMEHTGQ
ncbi:MAG: hypothetical protein Q9224_007748 [Gallowayella concinna]